MTDISAVCPRCNRKAIREGTEGWCIEHGSFDLKRPVPLDIPEPGGREDRAGKKFRLSKPVSQGQEL